MGSVGCSGTAGLLAGHQCGCNPCWVTLPALGRLGYARLNQLYMPSPEHLGGHLQEEQCPCGLLSPDHCSTP